MVELTDIKITLNGRSFVHFSLPEDQLESELMNHLKIGVLNVAEYAYKLGRISEPVYKKIARTVDNDLRNGKLTNYIDLR